MSTKAMDGLRVLDFSAGIAGPHTGFLLRRQGASVIKVEGLEGDWGRRLGTHDQQHSPYSLYFNQGKQSIALNLKHAEGLSIAQHLVTQADVVIESFRPGVMSRLGLGYETLKRTRPALIYLSISGYGPSGPLAEHPGTDSVMQAFSGLMDLNRGEQRQPQRFPYILIDVATGVYGCNLVASAYIRRLRYGEGGHLHCSLLEASLALQGAAFVKHQWEKNRLAETTVPLGVYASADGFVSISVSRPDQYERFCKAIDRPDWIEHTRFSTNALRNQHQPEFENLLREVFLGRSTISWIERFQQQDLLISPVRSYEEWVSPNSELASMAMAEYPATLNGMPLMMPLPPDGTFNHHTIPMPEKSPLCGEHTKSVLQQSGFSQAQIRIWLDQGVVAVPG